MSQSRARHAAPNPKRNIKALRTVRFWLAPIVITLALMSALAAFRVTRVWQMVTSYNWINVRTGPFSWQRRRDGAESG